MNVIAHNMLALNAQFKLDNVTTSKKKTTEKLSTGYRINRAADDAAGLAISEKMRSLIRGLDQGTKNVQDGVSFVQIADGALEEASDMLHRMNELAIKSANGTNSQDDRNAMEAEYNQLQTELDRITNTTKFNTQNVFTNHEETFSQIKGNVLWDYSEMHNVPEGKNTLTFTYTFGPNDTPSSTSIKVPAGTYTTQELVDEIDTALEDAGLKNMGFNLELTGEGRCNLNYEGGADICGVTGGLSYLLYKQYAGGSMGTLLGTTIFPTEDSRLEISSQNNTLEFTIEDMEGHTIPKKLVLANGEYTRSELIDRLNEKLADTTVEATPYGSGIKLASDDAIITGFKGNMFKIDTGDEVYSSVFYDNVLFGKIELKPSEFSGGAVLPQDSRNADNSKYKIDSTNNTLTFSPNGSDTPVSVTIPAGEYTAEQMASKLNSLFGEKSLELKATVKTVNAYSGLNITTIKKGLDANVGIDKTSSAYDTLFVNRTTNQFTTTSTNTNGTGASIAYCYGTRTVSADKPLNIVSGVNDSFKVTLTNLDASKSDYTITVAAGNYTSPTAIKDAINSAINSNSELKDRIKADIYSYSDSMKIVSKENGLVQKIELSPSDAANEGYADIFTTFTEVESYTAKAPTITTNTPVADSVTFYSSTKELYVEENGNAIENLRKVVFETGRPYTRDEIIETINNQLTGKTVYNDWGTKTAKGSNKYISGSGVGNTTYQTKSYDVSGKTTYVEGAASVVKTDTPAKVALSQSIHPTSLINSNNNTLKISINGQEKTITLAEGEYNRASLLTELQSKLDEAFGTKAGGAIVSYSSDNKLVFTARQNKADGTKLLGKNTSISMSTSNSSFLKDAEAVKTTATATSTYALNDSITLHDDGNEFTFSYKDPAHSSYQDVTLKLASGTYSKSSLVSAMNAKLADYNIVASTNSDGKLVLASKYAGSGYGISYTYSANKKNYNFFADAFKQGATAGSAVVSGYSVKDTITIDDDTNQFNLTVNGQDVNLTLKKGTYNQSSFANMLNDVLKAKNVPVTASIDNYKHLVLKHQLGGDYRTIKLAYSDAGNSMKAIYGTTTYDTITASFDSENRLVLTKSSGTGTIHVNSISNRGSVFQSKTKGSLRTPTSNTAGTTFSKVDGRNLEEPIVIDQYNKDLNFRYNYGELLGGNSTSSSYETINITLSEGVYNTYDDLKNELQNKLDGAMTHDVSVSVDSSGVVLKAKNQGAYFNFSALSGGFYDRVINTVTPKTTTQSTNLKAGSQGGDIAYTVGRKDIRNNKTVIKTDINDELTLDYTVNGNKITLKMTLDAGEYSGRTLVNHVQSKLSEQLTAKGLDSELIKVQIGGVSTGVAGSDDSNAMVFRLNPQVKMEESGEYIIDGVSGSAAFSVFYKTDGEIGVAYAQGSKELPTLIKIEDGQNNLSFDYDGTKHTVDIPTGEYTHEELVDCINDQLRGKVNALATVEDGNLKIYSTKFGKHPIDNISGDAKKVLFFDEDKAFDEDHGVRIQVSNNTEDFMNIDKRRVDTAFLGINSTTISKEKYALKAIDRLNTALDLLNGTRSYLGAMQNRMEHTMKNNDNKSENTQAAESLIRDTNMATTMMEQARLNILENVSTAMLSNANNSTSDILRLLQ